MRESRMDFLDSQASFKAKKFKWAIIQCYYSIFHSARAVLFSFGLKERSHAALALFLEDLVKKGKLEPKYANDFKAAMFTRESADYQAEYSRERAEELIEIAKEFNRKMRELVQK
ncbi:MAG: HEPN domain-containing protein [Candidatus Hadarchaeales archaeon]